MYFMLTCQTPSGVESALTSYRPDKLPSGLRRNWAVGKRFPTAPATPVRVEIEEGESGVLLELITGAIPLMTRRLADVLAAAGVANVECFDTEIHDLQTGEVHRSHVAFNIVGAIAAADLSKSKFDASQGVMVAVDFESLAIDPAKAREALLFRLAESVNGIVVHQKVRAAIEKAGIDTLTFLPPEKWVG
ncbi:MAG: hypothetical protein JNM17_04320 [Archangium sp.]|nr:hypothetical protein [Archangium sp.]